MFTELIADLTGEMTGMDTEVQGIAYDSRKVRPGDVFVALRGGTHDGIGFVDDAIAKGASVVVYEADSPIALKVPSLRVESSRKALAALSRYFYGNPSGRLSVVGVTGTNGKTTTTLLIKGIVQSTGAKAGLIGTINYMVGEERIVAPHTTPEAPEFQALLARMLDSGCAYAVAEVSSHALAQHRVDGTRFKVAVWTNLTRDHLDYHNSMEEYFEAKTKLFMQLLDGPAVINIDDAWGLRLAERLRGRQVITYGFSAHADLMVSDVECLAAGSAMNLNYKGVVRRMSVPIVGMVNVYNALAAIGAALGLGIRLDEAIAAIAVAGQVPGRFEKLDRGQDFLCVIDYAHTEDALERLINTARQITPGRVITVFGCGGDRDRGKRPMMGAASTTLSDMTIVTSDNPRSEDPIAIIGEILQGARGLAYRIVPQREQAIAEAIAMARAGDTVLIAGKGHEDYQEIGGVRSHFSDSEVAARYLELKRATH